MYEPIARARKVTLRLDRPGNLAGTADRTQVFVVLTSLILLAVGEVDSGSTIECNVAWSDITDPPQFGPRFISIVLSIPGCNLPDPEAFQRLKSPSDTAPESVNRMQVLGMCFALLRDLGGSLEVQAANQGSHIAVLWPIESRSAPKISEVHRAASR